MPRPRCCTQAWCLTSDEYSRRITSLVSQSNFLLHTKYVCLFPPKTDSLILSWRPVFLWKGFPTTPVPAWPLCAHLAVVTRHLVCSFRIRLSSSFLDWIDRGNRNIKHRAHPSHHYCNHHHEITTSINSSNISFFLAYTMLIIPGCLSPSEGGEIFDLNSIHLFS